MPVVVGVTVGGTHVLNIHRKGHRLCCFYQHSVAFHTGSGARHHMPYHRVVTGYVNLRHLRPATGVQFDAQRLYRDLAPHHAHADGAAKRHVV